MKLVIVESPKKCETIGHYLGSDYQVMASQGHIRDLSTKGKGGLGIDVEHDFKPDWVIDSDKVDIVNKLKAAAKRSDEVILATDPDREGEAISWHLAQVLGLDVKTTKRLQFHGPLKPFGLETPEHPHPYAVAQLRQDTKLGDYYNIVGFQTNLTYPEQKRVFSLIPGLEHAEFLRYGLMDDTKTVGQVLKENGLQVISFIRYQVGEGIAKAAEAC